MKLRWNLVEFLRNVRYDIWQWHLQTYKRNISVLLQPLKEEFLHLTAWLGGGREGWQIFWNSHWNALQIICCLEFLADNFLNQHTLISLVTRTKQGKCACTVTSCCVLKQLEFVFVQSTHTRLLIVLNTGMVGNCLFLRHHTIFRP
jgi:hypothetical protein